ncbi:hypothetical protein [Cobetia sp. Ld8]|uniref:hypothetical protein n=1 Tax=Cobetia sp. Ld8 TaxID=649154 RepID=UPI00386A62F4
MAKLQAHSAQTGGINAWHEKARPVSRAGFFMLMACPIIALSAGYQSAMQGSKMQGSRMQGSSKDRHCGPDDDGSAK